MNFSCSNIAWTAEEESSALDILHMHGVRGVEVAPTVVWSNWEGANKRNANTYKEKLRDRGFEIPAMQAIMFGKTATSIFEKSQQVDISNHLALVAELASGLEAKAVVFGSPKLRKTDLPIEDAINEVIDFFRKVAIYFNDNGSCFCIEPCGERYGSTFITSAKEAVILSKEINHPGFGVHIDSSALFEANEVIEDININDIKHYHISEPDLVDFSNSVVPHIHNLQYLKESNYKRWCSVEMKNSNIPLQERGPWNIIKSLTK
jgi:sugar phosphate isomerase/epimerase